MKRLLPLLGLMSFAAPANAQRTVAYDTVAMETPAAVSCGFCAGEKFGVVFREIGGVPGSLGADDFPLTLNQIELGVAAVAVTCSDCVDCFGFCGCAGGCNCAGAPGGTVSVMIEAYAGMTAPTASITSYPAAGPWPGEMMIFGQSADLMLSEETTPGTAMFNVMVNQVPVTPAVRVDPPYTYIRVAVTIPSGSAQADSCGALSLTGPGAVGIRDEGRIDNKIGFIHATGGIGTDEWFWNEEVTDPMGGATGINGDWLLRIGVTPISTTNPDAGVTNRDAGMRDSGTVQMDSGGGDDAGGGQTCTADIDCAGGQRCIDGRCRSVSCTAASDCAGGMTCVDMTCRNLCTGNSDCLGGEVCDTAAGYCEPIGMDTGCGCRTAGNDRSSGLAWLFAAIAGVIVVRRRRRS